MYSIAEVIYGVPLVQKLYEWVDQNEMWDAEDEGFLTYYHGGSDTTPGAFGIQIGGFDETCGWHPHYAPNETALKLSEIKTPTDYQKTQFQKLYDAQPPEVQKMIDAIGVDTYIIFSTS